MVWKECANRMRKRGEHELGVRECESKGESKSGGVRVLGRGAGLEMCARGSTSVRAKGRRGRNQDC